MSSNFDVFWGTLISALPNREHIRNWTVDSEYIGEDFDAQSKDVSIFCDPPGVDVTKEDFEKIWDVWEQYLNGEIKRQELRDIPHYNTKYVISILHHFMEHAW